MNTPIYDTKAGVKLTHSAEGWMFQNWWKSDTEWRLVSNIDKETYNDLVKTEVIGIDKEELASFQEALQKVKTERQDAAHAAMAVLTNSDPNAEMPQLNAEQKAAGIAGMKAEMIKNEGNVEICTVDEGIQRMGQLSAICALFDIKIIQDDAEVKMEDIALGLRTVGVTVFEMHLPDGDKFEIVMRYREDHSIRSFGYKI